MKRIYLFFICTISLLTVDAQVPIPFWKRVKVSQSMETAEAKEEPAQLQLTAPQKDSTSWLFNMGISYSLLKGSQNGKLKITSEYHKNTLTDSKQDNFSFGFKYYQRLTPDASSCLFMSVDPQYEHDAIGKTQSIAGNLLFTYYNDKAGQFHMNSHNYFGRFALKPSIYAGIQMQDVVAAANDSSTGLIIRPIATASLYFDIIKDPMVRPRLPLLRFSLDYIARTDASNSTLKKEGYTDLLKIGVEWFLVYSPVRVSIGGSFNNGSDPLKGLAKQQYWLISLNIYK